MYNTRDARAPQADPIYSLIEKPNGFRDACAFAASSFPPPGEEQGERDTSPGSYAPTEIPTLPSIGQLPRVTLQIGVLALRGDQ